MEVLDLGEPRRWPDGPRTVVEEIAAEVSLRLDEVESEEPGDPDEWGDPGDHVGFPACDLPSLDYAYSEEVERRLRAALGGDQLVAAYHATRLLPHEDDWIRAEGLGVLTIDLVEEKLRRAADAHPELLTVDDVSLLRRSGPLTWGGGRRLGLLCVVAPLSILDGDPGGFRNLIGDWGGEAIARTDNGPARALVARLTALSAPAIIEVGVAVGDFPTWKDLWPVAVGSLLKLRAPWNEWAVEVPVPGDRVVDIIHPGDPRWPEALPAS